MPRGAKNNCLTAENMLASISRLEAIGRDSPRFCKVKEISNRRIRHSDIPLIVSPNTR